MTSDVHLQKKDPPLRSVYEALYATFGHQGWWPGETPFEVCVGAILTQNTNWKNVERAIARLKKEQALEPFRLYQTPLETVAEWIRPAGYFLVKARRLRAFLKVLVEQFSGDLSRLLGGPLDEARNRLLSIPGIGPETADSMLLYAGNRPIFVIDAYTRRILARHGWTQPNATYDQLQRLCSSALWVDDETKRVELWKDAHAQFVRLAKEYCLARKYRCDVCPIKPFLPSGSRPG